MIEKQYDVKNPYSQKDLEKLKKAGEIAKKVKIYAKEIIRREVPLLEIAEKIEKKILELGGKPAFPVNLSINEIAAHSTPNYEDDTFANGLIKVDIGVHIDGFIADTAFSIDLENNAENKKLIEAVEIALEKAIEIFSIDSTINEIGRAIEETIRKRNFNPIVNLSGHSIEKFTLHAGLTIPNTDNSKKLKLVPGVYAIEPFATAGSGKVIDGKKSQIYILNKEGNIRDSFARKILLYIREEYKTLPFCSRWIFKKFGSRALLALRRLEEANLLHNYSQLVESDKKPVSQAEHTLIITTNEKIITT